MNKYQEYGIMVGVFAMVIAVVIFVLALPTQPAKSSRVKSQDRVTYHHQFDPNSTGLNGLGIDGEFIGDQPWKFDPTTGQFGR
jgi:hypothetical protein